MTLEEIIAEAALLYDDGKKRIKENHVSLEEELRNVELKMVHNKQQLICR